MSHPRSELAAGSVPLRPLRAAALLVAACVGAGVTVSLSAEYGLPSAVLGGALCGGLVAALTVAGPAVLAWMRAHPILTALLLGSATHVVLLSLRIFTPLEDLVVGAVAGGALAALIASETGDRSRLPLF